DALPLSQREVLQRCTVVGAIGEPRGRVPAEARGLYVHEGLPIPPETHATLQRLLGAIPSGGVVRGRIRAKFVMALGLESMRMCGAGDHRPMRSATRPVRRRWAIASPGETERADTAPQCDTALRSQVVAI